MTQPNSDIPADAPKPVQATTSELAQPAKPQEENLFVEVVKTIGLSILLALGLRAFVVEVRYIPTGSMIPTLMVNDRLIVEKVSYHFTEPERGDIVVFSPPESAGQSFKKEAFIKRVIGLPGEEIEVTGGVIYVNGEPLDESYIPSENVPTYEWGPETVPEGSYLVLGDNRNDSYDGHEWGFLPDRNIIGRAVFRLWPFDNRFGIIRPEPEYHLQPDNAQG